VPAVLERNAAVRPAFAGHAAFMDHTVMAPAKLHEVVEARLTAVCPMRDVVAIDEKLVGTAWKAATVVSCAKCAANGGWNGACFPPDGQRLPVIILQQGHPRAVAGDAA
jgi:hypothetical protein